MGFTQRGTGKYVTILNGRFSMRVADGTPGATVRKNKLGKQVSEMYYDSFVGKLIGIRTQDSAYGKNWVFDFQDSADVYHLQLSYSNSFATNILKMLPNVDLTKEMKVSPQVKEVDGKQKSSLFINQDGKSLKHAYTKDAPNGMPPMEQVTVKGNIVWDDTKIIEFLYNMVQKDIIPKLPKAADITPVSDQEEQMKDELDAFDTPAAATEGDDGF